MASTSAIPAGYTFLNPDTMMTVKGKEFADDLRKKADGRDPDAFGMYIYNDFFGYAMVDLIDSSVTSLNGKFGKKNLDEAYSILEALTVFMDFEGEWTQIDDGDRVSVTNKVYGALAIAVLRGLKKAGRLEKASFPSLESLLKNITSVGETLEGVGCDSDYAPVARGIARRLFKDKSKADLELEQKQREEWFKGIEDAEEKELMAPAMKTIAKERKGTPWYMKGQIENEDARNSNLSLSSVYKEYKAYLSGVPREPMKGPSWDIVNWTPAEKKRFSFDDMMDSDDY